MPTVAGPQEHPSRSSIGLLAPDDTHRKAYDLALLVRGLKPDPTVTVGDPPVAMKPVAIFVGSFAFAPGTSRDFDIQLNMSWDHAQEQLAGLVGRPISSAAGSPVLVEAKPTIIEADGTIDHKKGNAHVVVWGKLSDGTSVNFSVPHLVTPDTKRYKFDTVTIVPTLSFEESSMRRTFAHEAGGFDPLTGEVFDPHGGLECLASGTLKIINPTCFASDPLHAYRAFSQMSRRSMKPDAVSKGILGKMSQVPLPTDPATLQPERLRYERFDLFKGVSPGNALRALIECGFHTRDFPQVTPLVGTDLEPMIAAVEAAALTAHAQESWTADAKGRLVLAHVVAYIALATKSGPEADFSVGSPAAEFLTAFTFNQRREDGYVEPMTRDEMHEKVIASAKLLA